MKIRRAVRGVGIVVLWILTAPFCQAQADPGGDLRTTIKALEHWIGEEVAAKRIPSLSLAVVDRKTVLWAHDFGPDSVPNAHGPDSHLGSPIYRVGSVSKPFTALLLMMLAEQGKIDLDAPIQTYLPEFQPKNTTDKKITLRQIFAHRSGIVREPPEGNYFDDRGVSLETTVKSLNGIDLVYPPEKITSYSNAAISVGGYVAERVLKKPFNDVIQERVLKPLGMSDSSFDPHASLRRRLPKALMWTYHGREFPAPKWDFGMAPAGSLYSPALDQAKFLQFLLNRGETPTGRLVQRETLEKMWTIAYPKEGEKAGFGIGFFVSEFEGKKRVGHGGAVYGFATTLAALPDDDLGVIVCASRDVSNGLTGRITDTLLRHFLALKAGKSPPAFETTTPVEPELAKKLAGTYQSKEKTLELYERGGHLWVFPPRTGQKIEVRKRGDALVFDDILGFGAKLEIHEDTIVFGKDTYRRKPVAQDSAPLPSKWEGLLGEYGPDFNVLTILEKDGALHALIEWVFLYPLKEVGPDTFQFPDYGLYHGDKVIFKRDAQGQAMEVNAASVLFKRRSLTKRGETFRIRPVREMAEIRAEALKASPPLEINMILKRPELVELTTLDPTIKLDIRYASANNFLGEPLYTQARAFLQKPAAEALVQAHQKLEKLGYGLMIHDGYRPWHVTKMFREATPKAFHHFVADPAQGSRHNRGCAVDLTLFDRKTGKAVEMVGGYDEFSDRSYPDYLGGTTQQRALRDLLRRSMEDEGFKVYEAEWWHFDFHAWRQYPILNETFENLHP